MDFAVIKTGGKQYLVEKGMKLKVEKLDKKEGDKVEFANVLLAEKSNKLEIGKPEIKSAKVEAKVLKQDKAKKIIVFKYKAKKRYKVKKGHRQPFTEVQIIKV